MPTEMPLGLPFVVDTWGSSSRRRRRHRFLTHAHSDHLANAQAGPGDTVYATGLTMRLALQRFPQLERGLFVEMELGKRLLVGDPDGHFSVTAYDANHCPEMKRGNSPTSSWEKMQFGAENALTIFPPNTFNFNPKRHVVVNNRQQCLLDNFWYQANNAKENKGYFCSVLNSLAEYFNEINKILPKSAEIEARSVKPLYVLFDGKKPGIYVTFDDILLEKVSAKRMNEDVTWRKYLDINEALTRARSGIGENYYIEPAAKAYIESTAVASAIQKGEASGSKKPKEEESQKYGSYKQCLIKGVDPLDGEYIDQKIDEKMEEAKNSIISEIKEQVLREVRGEVTERFYELKTQYDEELKKFKEDHFVKFDIVMQDSQLPE